MLKKFFTMAAVCLSIALTACGVAQPIRVVSDAEYIQTELGKTETLCPKGQVFRSAGTNVQTDVRTDSWSEVRKTNRPSYDYYDSYYGRGRYSHGGVTYDQGTRAQSTHQGVQKGTCVPITTQTRGKK